MERGQVHVLALGVKDYSAAGSGLPRTTRSSSASSSTIGGSTPKASRACGCVLHGADVTRKNVRGSSTRSPARSRTARRTRSWSSWPATPASSTPSGSVCCCRTIRFPRRSRCGWRLATSPRTSGENDKVDAAFVLPYSPHRGEPGAAQSPQPAGDRGRLPGRIDPGRPPGPRDPQVDGGRLATSPDILPHGRPPGRNGPEVVPLKHGLFTYTLLRGMRAIQLDERAQGGRRAGICPVDADFNRDGIVSTDELDAYAKQVLPRLSGIFPQFQQIVNAIVPRTAGRAHRRPVAAAARSGPSLSRQ